MFVSGATAYSPFPVAVILLSISYLITACAYCVKTYVKNFDLMGCSPLRSCLRRHGRRGAATEHVPTDHLTERTVQQPMAALMGKRPPTCVYENMLCKRRGNACQQGQEINV